MTGSTPGGPTPSAHPRADSAGVPWAGRTLAPAPFAGDDGSVPPALAAVLDARGGADPDRVPGSGSVDVEALVAVLPGLRLFVPVVAVLGEASTRGPAGGRPPGHLVGDSGADMALPSLRSPDGRRALPVFSSVAALAAWDRAARPVPVEARRVALSAVQEGHDLLVLDPGPRQRHVVVPRPALWALAQGRPWTPSPKDAEVGAAVRAAVADLPGVLAVATEAGHRAELRVVLTLPPGLDAGAREAVTTRASAALAASAVVAERVDSLELGLRS